ncbi:hypothetical protein PspLS_00306 [Pyricularia sp. CBS 133598]|nr:hypothetical protein PspLS_00306 [Pyricularia sp. CBS 133598]
MQGERSNTHLLVPKFTRPGAQGRTKSRNGCLTCKQRRKKCDEARPKCGACAIERWDCEFPPAKSIAKVSRPKRFASGSATIARPTFLPGLTPQELEMFSFYTAQRMSSIDLCLNSPGADEFIIKMSITEPCVRHAVLAASYAVRDSFWPAADHAERASNLRRLLRHYNLAIKELVRIKEEVENQEAMVTRRRPDRISAIMCASVVLASADHVSAHLFETVLGEDESAGKLRTMFHLKAFCAILQDTRTVSLIDDGGGGAWDRKSQFDDDISSIARLVSTFLTQNGLYEEEVQRFKTQNKSAGSYGWNRNNSRTMVEDCSEMEIYHGLTASYSSGNYTGPLILSYEGQVGRTLDPYVLGSTDPRDCI